MNKIIYAKRDSNFKNNGHIHIWSKDYPEINKETYTFSDGNSSSCRMAIINAAKDIEDRVREKDGEPLFEIHKDW